MGVSENHKDVPNPSGIDVVEEYPELKKLFEKIVDNYIELQVDTSA